MKASCIPLVSAALLATFAVGSTAAPTADQPDVIVPLILGGQVVPIGAKTYVVGLRDTADMASFCGGSLISPKHVLTAAHCTSVAYVSIGTHYLSGTSDGEQIKVVKQTPHPSYSAVTKAFDVQVLELERESRFTPVAFGGELDYVVGSTATTIGWGDTTEGGKQSTVLLSVDIPIVADASCSLVYGGLYSANTMLCAGGQRNRDSCQGDSGGPLVVSKNGTDALIGVVSFGRGCGRPNIPGIYARVPALLPWIKSAMTVTPPHPTPPPTPPPTPSPTPSPTTAAPTPNPKPSVLDRCQPLSELLCAELQCEWNAAVSFCSSYQ